MTINDLRIGNIVLQLGLTESIVTAIDGENQTISTLEMSERSVDDFDGVLLTSSKLLELGFSEITGRIYDLGEFYAFLNTDNSLSLSKYGVTESIIEDIYFVHKLQNIYFELTGNELSIIKRT